jgi:hypothetical protein
MHQKKYPDDQIKNRDEELPEYAAGAFRLEGMDKLKSAAEDNQPPDDYDHAERCG